MTYFLLFVMRLMHINSKTITKYVFMHISKGTSLYDDRLAANSNLMLKANSSLLRQRLTKGRPDLYEGICLFCNHIIRQQDLFNFL